MTKSDKMYSKSPKIEKDEKGKPKITKPTKADGESMGTEGSPLEGASQEMPIDIHEKERQSMHKRHEEELIAMHDRHSKDLREMHKRHHETTDTGKTGGDQIAKVKETE
jgi:hypothetical protein